MTAPALSCPDCRAPLAPPAPAGLARGDGAGAPPAPAAPRREAPPIAATATAGAPSGGRSEGAADTIACACGRRFPVRAGIPVLFPSRSRHLEAAALARFDDLDRPGMSWAASHWERIRAAELLRRHHQAGPRLLSVGCASGADNARYRELGFAPVAFDIVPSRETSFVGDAHALPLADASFDLVTCFEVLEHLEDPAAAVAEMGRVTRPGGTLFVSVAFLKPFHGSYFHMSHWGLLHLLTRSGFTPLTVFGHQYPLLQIYGNIYPLWSRAATVRFYNALDGTGRRLVKLYLRTRAALRGQPLQTWRDPKYGVACDDELALVRAAAVVALARRT